MRTIVALPVHPRECHAADQIPNEGHLTTRRPVEGGDTTKRMPSASDGDRVGDQEGKDRSDTLVTCPRRFGILEVR
jgi:hypothetical protein